MLMFVRLGVTWRDFTMLSCYCEYTLETSIYLFLELHSTYFLAGWLAVMLRHAKDDLHIWKLGWALSHVKGVYKQGVGAL